MRMMRAIVTTLALGAGAVHAQNPAPPGMGLPDAAAQRFPQPVAVGALVGRRVLEPLESQPTLGYVNSVVKAADGQINVVVNYGGVAGLFARPIAVPADAMVLLGPYMEIVDFKPDQLETMQTYDGTGFTVLPAGDVIRVGLARPSH